MSLPPSVIADMMAHKNDNMQANMYAAEAIGLVLPLIAVGLRLYCRSIMRQRLWADDWVILAALIPLIGMQVTGMIAVYFGFGVHLIFAQNLVGVAKAEIAIIACYSITILITKVSILMFYCRLMPTRSIQVGSYVIGSITVLYSLALFIIMFVVCIPLDKFWTPTLAGTCINTTPAFIALAIVNLVTDFAILLLPMKSVWDLHMSTARKWQVSGVFCLGGVVCIFGTIRAVAVATASELDVTWSNVDGSIWSSVEVGIGIVCACLPSMAPLVSKSVRPTGSRKYYYPNSGSYVLDSRNTDVARLAHAGSSPPKTIVSHGVHGIEPNGHLSDPEFGGIRVNKEVYQSDE